MVLDFWTYVNPILRILIYLVALISIGTILFNFHFEKFLDNHMKCYCDKILKRNSARFMWNAEVTKMILDLLSIK